MGGCASGDYHEGTAWRDPQFPYGFPDASWVRASRLDGGKDELFDRIDPRDIMQGQLGDCWLLAAMACLAEDPEAVKAIFHTKTLSPEGTYRMALHDHGLGRITEVEINDYIPCADNKPLFSQPKDNRLWVLLLEKAMAQLFGSYARLNGNFTAVAFKTFTGERNTFMWIRESADGWHKYGFQVGSNDPQRTTDKSISGDDIFDCLSGNDSKNFMMGASIMPTGGPNPRPDGLVEGHAYSLLQVKVVNNFKMLLFRNPWAQMEWNGKWSDADSDSWNSNPEVKKLLRPEFVNDGLFWMCWEDCRRIWTGFDVCCRTMRHGADAKQKDEHPGEYWKRRHLHRGAHKKDGNSDQCEWKSSGSGSPCRPADRHHKAGHHPGKQQHHKVQQHHLKVHQHKAHHHKACHSS